MPGGTGVVPGPGGTAMQGVFGCPECGARITLDRKTAGRRVRCGRCATLVEVPFLPRAAGGRRRRKRWPWAKLGAGAVAAVLLAIGARFAVRRALDARHADAVAAAVAELDAAEDRGDLGSAYRAAEAALTLAESHGVEPPGGRSRLVERRDELARREVEARLDALGAASPDLAFGEARTLAARVAADPALTPLDDRVADALAESARSWMAAHLEGARRLVDAGRLDAAVAEAERLQAIATELPHGPAREVGRSARAFAAEVVAAAGVRQATVEVEETIDAFPTPGYGALEPLLRSVLAERGYVPPPPAGSPMAGLWAEAPSLLRVTIAERLGSSYQQSPHRTSLIAADLALEGPDGRPSWREYVEARTGATLSGLGSLAATRVATGGQRDPAIERRLYDDARERFVEKLLQKLRSLPTAPAPSSRGGPS